jgi:hypothetical protein
VSLSKLIGMAGPLRATDEGLVKGTFRSSSTEARSQEEGIIGRDQVDLGIDRRMGRQRYFLSGGGKLDCADKAGRPSGGEKLFRGWVRIRQLSLMSRLPSVLRANPSRPLVV